MNINRNFNPGPAHPFFFIRRGLFQAIQQHAPSLKGKLLDFGCGSKPYQPLFTVEEYIGLDFEKTGHDHTNEQIDVYYDGKTIPFGNEHFDSVLCSEVAEHLFELPAALAEMNRVLKKEGKLLLTCPFVWGEHEVPYDYARYTQYALKDLLEKQGFRILVYEKRGTFIQTLTQMRVLYFAQVTEPVLAKLSYPGTFIFKSMVWIMNNWGRLKNRIFPQKQDLYLSNIILAEKI